jgi:hypothetical protein
MAKVEPTRRFTMPCRCHGAIDTKGQHVVHGTGPGRGGAVSIAAPLAFNTGGGNRVCGSTALRIRDFSVFTEINPRKSGNPPPGLSHRLKCPPHDVSAFMRFES